MMDNLRRCAFSAALKADRRSSRELAFFRAHERDRLDGLRTIQRERLVDLLRHAAAHVPYYRRVLREHGVVIDGDVNPAAFESIPVLTRDSVRRHFEELKSDDLHRRKWYPNKTGGSTGEPLTLVQEVEDSKITGGATLRWFYGWHGVRPGDREIKLWGSDRDLFHGAPPWKKRFISGAAGIRLLNAFKMTPELMRTYVEDLDRFRPVLLRGYGSNLYELACFAEANALHVRPPRLIISSAGKLYPHMRQKMEAVFGCKVFDHYGTREVHNVAIECEMQDGLHLNVFTHLVEVLDDAGRILPPGEEGRIVITTLLNRVMPLIRYDIGDRGVMAASTCRCGRELPRLQTVVGRSTDCFRTREGRVISGEFFIYLLVVAVNDSPFKKIQAIQDTYDRIRIHMVLHVGRRLEDSLRNEIVAKTRIVMGSACRVVFDEVDDIPTPPSGKYRYTICNLDSVRDARRLPADDEAS